MDTNIQVSLSIPKSLIKNDSPDLIITISLAFRSLT